MKTNFIFLKKTVAALIILIAAIVGAQAQTPWSGTVNVTTDQTFSTNITLTGNTTLNITSGVTATVSGVISGAYSITVTGGGKLVLTRANTYTGQTIVNDGMVQIGNGTSGSISNTSGVVLSSATSVLRFEPGADMDFSKVISGAGSVQFKGTEGFILQKTLSLSANNTYTGTTTIEQGVFCIGDDSTTGAVAGNIILNDNAVLSFSRTDSYTYSGNISGTGIQVYVNSWFILNMNINLYTSGTVILTGANTYTAKTIVSNGVFQIGDGTSGSITSDISLPAGSVLCFNNSNDYTYPGVISGLGNVKKQGTGVFSMNSVNDLARGTFTQIEGTVKFSGKWAGNFIKNAAGTLEIVGNASVDSTLTLGGGNLVMDLTQATPSKLVVGGAVSALGTNTLAITAPDVAANYVLIQAASGITNTTPFALNLTGAKGTLAVNAPTQLLLNTMPTGINDVALPDVRIYPNPCTTTLFVENAGGADINMMDMTGRLIWRQNNSSDLQKIPVGNLNPGIYMLQLTKDGLVKAVKVVKR